MSEFLTLQNMYRKIQEISYTNMYNLCYNDKLYLLVVYFSPVMEEKEKHKRAVIPICFWKRWDKPERCSGQR